MNGFQTWCLDKTVIYPVLLSEICLVYLCLCSIIVVKNVLYQTNFVLVDIHLPNWISKMMFRQDSDLFCSCGCLFVWNLCFIIVVKDFYFFNLWLQNRHLCIPQQLWRSALSSLWMIISICFVKQLSLCQPS